MQRVLLTSWKSSIKSFDQSEQVNADKSGSSGIFDWFKTNIHPLLNSKDFGVSKKNKKISFGSPPVRMLTSSEIRELQNKSRVKGGYFPVNLNL